jgi:hypothetical protein
MVGSQRVKIQFTQYLLCTIYVNIENKISIINQNILCSSVSIKKVGQDLIW